MNNAYRGTLYSIYYIHLLISTCVYVLYIGTDLCTKIFKCRNCHRSISIVKYKRTLFVAIYTAHGQKSYFES